MQYPVRARHITHIGWHMSTRKELTIVRDESYNFFVSVESRSDSCIHSFMQNHSFGGLSNTTFIRRNSWLVQCFRHCWTSCLWEMECRDLMHRGLTHNMWWSMCFNPTDMTSSESPILFSCTGKVACVFWPSHLEQLHFITWTHSLRQREIHLKKSNDESICTCYVHIMLLLYCSIIEYLIIMLQLPFEWFDGGSRWLWSVEHNSWEVWNNDYEVEFIRVFK